MDALPQLSLGTAALVIFLLCAAYVVLRGVTRVLIGTAVFTVSIALGFFTWKEAPALSVDWLGKSVPAFTNGLPLAVFVITFVAIRVALRWIASPFGEKEEKAPEGKTRSGLSFTKVTILLGIALIPTFVLMTVGVGVIHHTGSVQELRQYASQQSSPTAKDPKSILLELKRGIESIIPRSWLEQIDPLANQSRMAIAKLIAAGSKPELKPEIDPSTGQPIPRAIIVDDPELQQLAREQKFGALLRHPVITKALEDPEVRKLLKELK